MTTNTITKSRRNAGRRRGERGNFLVEFALSMIFLLVPMFFGVVFLSLGLGRSMQTESVCRDAGNMYARGVDFSIAQNKNVIVRLGAGIGLQAAAGPVVVYLTSVTYVTDTDCAAAGLTVPCPNRNMVVVTQRQVVGVTSVGASRMASPTTSLLDTQGNLSPQEYLQDASARVPSMGGPGCTGCLASLNPGEDAWIAEVLVSAADFAMPGFAANNIYSRTVI